MTGTPPPVKEKIIAALGTVIDPEVGMDLVSLGLIYGVNPTPQGIHVVMTLTTPGCPMGEVLYSLATSAARAAAPEQEVTVELRWDPPWSPAMMIPGVRP